MNDICVVGCGYIGLPTAAMFASHGCDVLAVDVAERVVDLLNQGLICIEEPGLEDVVQAAVAKGNLRGSTHPEPADVFIVAVPTPFSSEETRSCDLSYVLSAVESILPVLKKGGVLIVESTIAPRSMDDYVKPLIESKGFVVGEDIFLAHCPERVLPGKILHELVHNNRIVGGVTPACADAAADVYKIFVQGEILKTEAKTAEMAKCMENTFRDVNIALANELAKVCNKLEINCHDVIDLANKHPRVNLHTPGPGVGGHCLAIDPYFICAEAPDEAKMIRLARDINTSMPSYVCDKIEEIVRAHGMTNSEVKIAALGITYKGNVDDCRESPALEIVHDLVRRSFVVSICDPHALPEDGLSLSEVLVDADIALVLVDHDEFKGKALQPHVSDMHMSIVFDTRNIIDSLIGAEVVNYGNVHEYTQRVGRK